MNNGLTKNDSLALKGVAVLFLLFHHLFLDTERFANFTINFAPFGQDFVVKIAYLLRICVSIFAFISGYGLLKSISKTPLDKKSITKWNITRLLKTLSGFWFIYVISFIVTMIIDRMPITKYFSGSFRNGFFYIFVDFMGFAQLLDTPSLNGTWWYMNAAVIFILAVPIIYIIAKKTGYFPIVLMLCVLPRILATGYPGGLSAYTFLFSLIFGMIFAEYNIFERIAEHSPKNKIAAYLMHFVIFSVLIIIMVRTPYLSERSKIWEMYYGVVPVFFILFIKYCVICIPVLRDVLQFLGRHSMAIFLTHTFLRLNYLNEFIYTRGHFVLVFLALFVPSVALAVLLDALRKLCKYDVMINKLTAKITAKIDNM